MFINCFQRCFGFSGRFGMGQGGWLVGSFLFLLVKNFSLSGRGGRNSVKGAGLIGETKGIFFLGLVNLVSSCFQWLLRDNLDLQGYKLG